MTAYTRALGARLLSEANDIKRTPEALAAELGLAREHVERAIRGELRAADYRALFERVAARYPIALASLWMEEPDTTVGVVHTTAAASAASSRVFARPGRGGAASPYYEYRDTAMSRTAPFRPEWIRMLRAVDDVDPSNPDVAYNKGHFLHQTTLFIGPVNFYWEVDGKRHAVALDTGDSNYITPFWPHSFTSRDPSRPALIIAVTYGAEVARARGELARMTPDAAGAVALDLRREERAHAQLLRRHLDHEALPAARFVDACGERGLAPARVSAVLAAEAVPTPGEIAVMADVLRVHPRDLMPPVRGAGDEVVIQLRRDAETWAFPDAARPRYTLTRLARASHQPLLKSFLVTVHPGEAAGGDLRVALHQYVFNHGVVPVRMFAREGAGAPEGDAERTLVLAPGDSAYVAPMVTCRFAVEGPGREAGELYLVRVPGELHADAVFELSGMAPAGVARSAAETTRWF